MSVPPPQMKAALVQKLQEVARSEVQVSASPQPLMDGFVPRGGVGAATRQQVVLAGGAPMMETRPAMHQAILDTLARNELEQNRRVLLEHLAVLAPEAAFQSQPRFQEDVRTALSSDGFVRQPVRRTNPRLARRQAPGGELFTTGWGVLMGAILLGAVYGLLRGGESMELSLPAFLLLAGVLLFVGAAGHRQLRAAARWLFIRVPRILLRVAENWRRVVDVSDLPSGS